MKIQHGFYFCLVWVLGCSKEEVTERNYPRVVTKTVTGITSEGAIFQGEISFSKSEIIDHGFTWSNSKTFQNAEVVSLGAKTGIGNFQSIVERSLATNIKYYVYAYAKSANHTVYGNVTEFISLGSKAPKISNFSPSKAKVLDTVKISGKYFSGKSIDNQVKFDSFNAEVFKSSDTVIWVKVPTDLNKEKSTISVTVFGNVGNSPTQFELIGPEIQFVSKTTIKPCDTLLITGNNFGLTLNQVLVKINDANCKVLSTSLKQLKILAPTFSPISPDVVLKVTSSNLERSFPTKLVYNKPIINPLIESSFTFSDTLKFTGILPACEKLTVKIGSTEVTPSYQSSSQLKIVIPNSLTTTQNSVQITYGQNAFTYQANFSLKQPIILSIEPATATFGEIITITGQNFSPTLVGNRILIGGVENTVLSASRTSIKVRIENQSANCSVRADCDKIILLSAGYSVISSSLFTFKRPIVNSVLPNVITKEGLITIIGQNFSPVTGNNLIKFNNQFFKTVSSSTTQITFNVSKEFVNNNNPYFSANQNLPLVVFISTDNSYNNLGLVSNQLDIAVNYKGPWTKKTDFPGTSRYQTISFSIGDKAYVGLGLDAPNQTYSKEMWEYSSTTDSWKKLADFPGAGRKNAVSFAAGGNGYVGLGITDGGLLSDLWEYDVMSDSWTKQPDFPDGRRAYSYSFVINDKAYVGSGQGFISGVYSVPSDLWSFDPLTKMWLKKNDSPEYTTSGLAFSDGVNGYVLNILDASNSKFSRYSPSTNSWSTLSNPTIYGAGNLVSGSNQNGFIFNELTPQVYQYNIAQNKWTIVGIPFRQYFNRIGFTINDKFYYGLGSFLTSFTNSVYLNEFWEFDMKYYSQ